MKHPILLSIVIVLFSLQLKAQSAFPFVETPYQVPDLKTEAIQRLIEKSQMQKSISDLTYMRDSVLQYSWNSTGNSWNKAANGRVIYEYRDGGKSVTIRFFIWQSSANTWINAAERLYQYNMHGDLTDYSLNNYDAVSGSWIPAEHDFYTFNSANVMTSAAYQNFNKSGNVWFTDDFWRFNDTGGLLEYYHKNWEAVTYVFTNGYHMTYSLNSYNRPSETVIQELDLNTGNWANSSQQLAHFTNDSIMDSEIINKWSGSDWVLSGQNIYSYTNNLVTLKINQEWDAVTLSWKDYDREESSYNTEGLMVEKLFSHRFGSGWVYQVRYAYAYDVRGHTTYDAIESRTDNSWSLFFLRLNSYNDSGAITDFKSTSYDLSNGQITYGYNYEYSYDENKQIDTSIYRTWSTAANEWTNSRLDCNYYSLHSTSGLNPTEIGEIRIFPNPASDILQISGLPSDSDITISDMKGNILINLPNYSRIDPVSISRLQKGIYLLAVSKDRQNRTFKFVKN